MSETRRPEHTQAADMVVKDLLGHVGSYADEGYICETALGVAAEQIVKLRRAVGSLLNWVETTGKRTPYEMPRSERNAFRELIGAVPKEGE